MGVGVSVKDVMIKQVVTAKPNEKLIKATKKIVAADIGSLVIVEKSKPIGILTRGDILKALISGADFDKSKVKDHMTSPVITIHANSDVDDVARLMRDKKVKRVPVVKETGELVGIISQTDIVSISPAIYEMIREKAMMER